MYGHLTEIGQRILLIEDILSEYSDRLNDAVSRGDEDEAKEFRTKIELYQARLTKIEEINNANH